MIYQDELVEAEIRKRSEAILQEIWEDGHDGAVLNGQDLDIFS